MGQDPIASSLRTVLRLPQGHGNLFVREALARHGIQPPSEFRMLEELALDANQVDGLGPKADWNGTLFIA